MLNARRLLALGGGFIVLGGALALFLRAGQGGHWEPLHRGKVTEAVYGLATLEADQIFRYRPAVIGQLKRLYVKEGDRVEKGRPLLALSEGPVIRSPITGVVTQLDAKESETCFPNTTLITVVNLDSVELSITLEQASALRVRNGQPVRIRFESVKGTPLTGRVRTLYPKEGQFAIRVSIDPDQLLPNLLPGMTADTAIETGSKENALLAPLKSIHQGVLTIEDDGKKRKIKPGFGLQDAEFIEVIPEGAMKLNESMRVWVGGS